MDDYSMDLSSWQTFPDLVPNVMRHMDAVTLSRASRVCHLWRNEAFREVDRRCREEFSRSRIEFNKVQQFDPITELLTFAGKEDPEYLGHRDYWDTVFAFWPGEKGMAERLTANCHQDWLDEALWMACLAGRADLIRPLVNVGSNVNSVLESDHTTLLHVTRSWLVMEVLIETYRLPLDAPAENGVTPLMLALTPATRCHQAAIGLCKRGAQVNHLATDAYQKGWGTPLGFLMGKPDRPLVSLLLEHRADPWLPDNRWHSYPLVIGIDALSDQANVDREAVSSLKDLAQAMQTKIDRRDSRWQLIQNFIEEIDRGLELVTPREVVECLIFTYRNDLRGMKRP